MTGDCGSEAGTLQLQRMTVAIQSCTRWSNNSSSVLHQKHETKCTEREFKSQCFNCLLLFWGFNFFFFYLDKNVVVSEIKIIQRPQTKLIWYTQSSEDCLNYRINKSYINIQINNSLQMR